MSSSSSSNDLLVSYLQGEEDIVKWDRIVLSVSDEQQALCNKHILQQKYGRDVIMKSGTKINILPDPPYLKKGNGGVIIYILKKLVEDFSEGVIFMEKILLILSGGYSKRFPTGSVIGKIFTALPSKLCAGLTMWDIKLAHTSAFSTLAPPGLFVTCADDIEPFILERCSKLKFGPHFTAICHPNIDPHLASQHGVYVSGADREDSCLEVLQKPSLQELQEIKDRGNASTFIDSAFFFTHEVSRTFIRWSNTTKDYWYDVELDAYGDFLTSLNTRSNSAKSKSVEWNDKSKLLHLLNEYSLDLLILRHSYFIHLGTNQEYLHNLTKNLNFMKEIGCIDASSTEATNVIHSSLSANTTLPKSSIVEFCNIQCDMMVGENVIISHCQCLSGPNLSIPSRIILQTIPISHPLTNKEVFVTMMFGIEDDLKTKINSETIVGLVYANKPLCNYRGLTCFRESTTLWSSKLFPSFNTEELSLRNAVKRAQYSYENEFVDTNDWFKEEDCLLSMEDIVRLKNMSKLMSMRVNIPIRTQNI